jgi:hypothetical protein
MHLLRARVDIATITLWLEYKRTETTHVYPETDLAMKALEKLDPIAVVWKRFHADDPLLAFLTPC